MAKKAEVKAPDKKSRWAAAQTKADRIQKDRKKARSKQQNNKNQQKKKGGMLEYFRGVKLEMRKVVWPTRKELGSFTVIVLCTCAAFALLFWGVDSGVLAAIKAMCF